MDEEKYERKNFLHKTHVLDGVGYLLFLHSYATYLFCSNISIQIEKLKKIFLLLIVCEADF